jgi:hypothetical protein
MGFRKRFEPPWRAAMLVAVGLAGGAAAWAVASVPDSGGVIHACVDLTNAGGTTVPDQSHPNVTIIDKDAGQHCIPPDPPVPNQAEVTWNITGPPGVAGGAGPPGQPGQSNTGTVVVAPPTVRSRDPQIGQVVLGTGRGALRFELLSYGFAPTNAAGTGGGGASGKVKFNEFRIVKVTDKASPNLFKACAKGEHFKSATITLAKKSGSGKKVYLVINLDEVVVSSYQAGSGGGGGARPVESLTLNFTKSQLVSK